MMITIGEETRPAKGKRHPLRNPTRSLVFRNNVFTNRHPKGGLFIRNRSHVAKLAIESALPTMFGHRQEAEAGGLMAYGTDVADLFRRAATYVDKILKGANPAEMPIEQPTKFDFVVNLKTAKTLGITIPQSILLRATKVIE